LIKTFGQSLSKFTLSNVPYSLYASCFTCTRFSMYLAFRSSDCIWWRFFQKHVVRIILHIFLFINVITARHL